ncbi:hypothetical protein ABBQ32_006454 [Trebouxia sp. C0010 RCD-2024]
MALVPLGNYVFFLAQLQTFGYVAVYFGILFWRYRAGIVTQPMLDTPKKQFLLIGALEAASSILGFVGAAKLPGVTLPLLSQTIMFWQIGLGYLLLGKKLAPVQASAWQPGPVQQAAASLPRHALPSSSLVDPVYAAIFVASMFFPALATIFKERIFASAKQRLNGQSLDIFVVNSFGSAAQALFVFLMLPVMSSLRGIPLSGLPAYIKQGNVVQTLVMSSMVPLTIFVFTLSLPYLPPAPPLGPNFWLGTVVLVVGLLTFNSPQWRPALQKKLQTKAA